MTIVFHWYFLPLFLCLIAWIIVEWPRPNVYSYDLRAIGALFILAIAIGITVGHVL